MTENPIHAPSPELVPQMASGGGRRLGLFSWALFDWANQPYFTLITTFIFAPYFAAEFIGDPVRGQALWGYTLAAAGVVVALFSPILGAIADVSGPRKPWIAAFGVLFVVSCSYLYTAVPGAPGSALWIAIALGLAAIAAEFAIVFNNAMLPSLVPEHQIGRLSGFGWGLGYLGGLVALLMIIGLPDAPFLGLQSAQAEAGRLVGPLTAIWFLIFALPLFLFTPDQRATGHNLGSALREGMARLGGTLSHARNYRNVGLFLIARMTYQDGLAAVFSFGGIYAAGLFGWDVMTLGLFGVTLVIFSAMGAFVGGWADDWFGARPTVLVSVAGLLFATVGALSITPDTILFVIAVPPPEPDAAPFSSMAEWAYICFGSMFGIFGGPAQAASRSLMARLAPRGMAAEFFGLFALSGKATSFLAPLAIGVTTGLFNDQRSGMLVILFFLALGFLLLLPVREERAEPFG